MQGASRTVRDRVDRAVAILRRSTRFYRRAALIAVLGATVGVWNAFTRPRVYKSEALILYRDSMRSSDLGSEGGGDAARKLGMRLKEMVFSRTSLQQIIDEFKL